MKKLYLKGLVFNGSDLSKTVLDCLEYLSDQEGVYGCDLHHVLFNMDQSYIYYNEAEKALGEVGTWAVIERVIEYHNENFGEFKPDSIDPCYFANVMVYIIGEELLLHSEHLNGECWDRGLTVEDLAIIEDELQSYLESLTFDLTKTALD